MNGQDRVLLDVVLNRCAETETRESFAQLDEENQESDPGNAISSPTHLRVVDLCYIRPVRIRSVERFTLHDHMMPSRHWDRDESSANQQLKLRSSATELTRCFLLLMTSAVSICIINNQSYRRTMHRD